MWFTWRLMGAAVEIGQVHAVGGENSHVAVGEEEHVAGVAQDRRHVGRDEILAVAQADHHRRAGARRDNFIRVGTRDHAESEDARQLPHSLAHCLFQIAVVIFFHQVRDDLGVGLGDELVPLQLQLLLQAEIILDDAVVHDDDVARAIAVRMRVLFGRAPVRGPARVTDAIRAVDGVHADRVFQIAQFPGGPPDCQVVVAV